MMARTGFAYILGLETETIHSGLYEYIVIETKQHLPQ